MFKIQISLSAAMKFFTVFAITCVLGIEEITSQRLHNPCRLNEFRCSDGSKCLKTEKLCNGVKECPRGEDETGSSQWDCSKTILSVDCKQGVEFKCRFGGCIPKNLICDGEADCWGGTDEAIEVCSGREKSPNSQIKPSSTQPPRRKPQSTIRTTQRIISTTTEKPEPTKKPIRIGVTSSFGSASCPALPENEGEGYLKICWFNEKPISCQSRFIPPGSIAVYGCKDQYTPPATGSSISERRCNKQGEWTPLRRSFVCSLDCGEGGFAPKGLITGGVVSKKGKWPWHVAIYSESSNGYRFICGGSLISARAVLTAGHCVVRKGSAEIRPANEFRLLFGKYTSTYEIEDESTQERKVISVDLHEEYNFLTYAYDIAIIWLDEPVEITQRVHPVCLPDQYEKAQPDPEYLGTIVGWGRTSGGIFKPELQEAQLPVIASRRCLNSHPTFSYLLTSERSFCAGYTNGTSACDGDSGGGMVFPDTLQPHKWKIFGIVSTGIAKPGGGCRENYYTVFTHVPKYRRWINAMIDRKYKSY